MPYRHHGKYSQRNVSSSDSAQQARVLAHGRHRTVEQDEIVVDLMRM